MKLGKLGLAGLAFVALGAILSGCLVFKAPPTAKQIKDKPKVAVKFTICESNDSSTSSNPDCPDQGNANSASGSDARVLIALRVQKGTKVPQQFRAKSVTTAAGSASNAMVRDGSFKREMNQKAPKGQNFKWYGYISENTADSTGTKEAKFKVKLKVPQSVVGKKFKVAPTVGWTVAEPGKVDCGDSVYEPGPNSVCVDDPAPDELKNLKVEVEEKK